MEIESASFEPYQFRAKLYVMHLCFVFTSRMWDMGIVFLLADLTDNSMGVVAFAGLLTNLSIVLFMPRSGALLDQTNRLVASEVALGVKFLTLTTAYAVCAYLAHDSHDPAHEYLVYLLPVLCAVAGLSFNTISQSVEKDWIVVLSAGDSAWLSLTNSVLTQIDSAVNSVAPAVTGFIFLACSQTESALVLLGANLVASALLYFFLRDLYTSWPALARRSHDPPPSVKAPSIAAASNKAAIAADAPATSSASLVACCSLRDYDDFRQSGCASAMVAYAFLFLTVLNFGSLMTVFLRSAGLSDGWIGLARGVGAFTGLLGAVVFPFVNSCFGLYATSAMAIALQNVLVVAAALSFFVCPPHVVVAVLVFAVVSVCAACAVVSSLMSHRAAAVLAHGAVDVRPGCAADRAGDDPRPLPRKGQRPVALDDRVLRDGVVRAGAARAR